MLNSKTVCALVLLLLTTPLAGCSQEIITEAPTEEVLVETALESPSGPDLMILSLEVTDPIWFMGFRAIAKVVVTNVGDRPASGFDVGIVGVNREDRYVPFGFSYDSALAAELAPRQQVTLEGETGLTWHGHFDVKCSDEDYDPALCAMRGENILWLMAIVDYCEANQVSDGCAVEETNEANNLAGPVVLERPEIPVPPTDTPTPVAAPTDTLRPTATPPPHAVVNVQALSVRKGPGTVYDRIGIVCEGDRLEIVGEAYGCAWLRVSTPEGILGWVSGAPAYVTPNIACSAIRPVEIPPIPTATPTDIPAPTATPPPRMPIVVLMDYDAHFVDHNADVLASLPIRIWKEITNPNWAREEEIVKLDPDLVVMHWSAFYDPTNPQDHDQAQKAYEKFDLFLDRMVATQAEFMLYSGGFRDKEETKAYFEGSHPNLEGRIHILLYSSSWDKALEDEAVSILGLD